MRITHKRIIDNSNYEQPITILSFPHSGGGGGENGACVIRGGSLSPARGRLHR